MEISQKVVSLTFLLVLLPSLVSSQEQANQVGNCTGNDNNPKLSPQLTFEATVHGFLLWASMGFLMPVGILIIRMSKTEECRRRLKILVYVHAALQIVSVLLVTAGAIMSIKNFENAFNNHHQRLGLALYGIIWLPALIGFFRPQRGTNGRSVWFFTHWILGTALSLLGIINIYTGLEAYHRKTRKSVRVWTILFTIQISFIASFYLFQEKWEYIQKQGVILGNEPTGPTNQQISPKDKKKEVAMEPC